MDREQRAAEAILTDPGLTDNLDDQPAQHIIDWSMRVAKRVARSTQGLNDDEALPVIQDEMYNVRRLIRRINKLFGELPDAADDDISTLIDKIFASTEKTTVVKAQSIPDTQSLLQGLRSMSPTEIVQHILSHLTLSGEDASEDQSPSLQVHALAVDEPRQLMIPYKVDLPKTKEHDENVDPPIGEEHSERK